MKQIIFCLLMASTLTATAAVPDTLELTLDDAIMFAQARSSDSRVARHSFLASEWSYKFYKANYLPSLTFSSSPALNRAISKITLPDGTSSFVRQNQLSTNATLSLTQNIALTGGQLFLKSTLLRNDEFENKTVAYNSQPVVIGYQQTLFGYNSLKWSRRIEPLYYSRAEKSYNESLELIASRAVTYFFAVAQAQTELEIALYNYASADKLNRYARGRYDIGRITESEMLQLELNRVSAEANVLSARNQLDDAMQTLCSYLSIDNGVVVEVKVDPVVPSLHVEPEKVLALAREYSPDPVSFELRLLEGQSNLAQAKANSGLQADLYFQLGLSQTADNLPGSYRSPLNQEYASIGISLPILDWGRGKGRVKVAESNLRLIETQVEQEYKDFEINIGRLVRQFNLQAYRVEIAAKTAQLAQQRYDVARHLYMLGKSTILDFNTATQEKDAAYRGHISAIEHFWSLYYGLRSMTGGKVFE